MNKKILNVLEHAKLDQKAHSHDNDLVDDVIDMLRRRRSSKKKKKLGDSKECLEESQMILDTEERQLLERQIARITFIDEDDDTKNQPLPTEERIMMEEFRTKLVCELEEFNKNVDEQLKAAGELHLEEESDGRQIDLEKDGILRNGDDMFTQSYQNMNFKEKITSGERKHGLKEPQISDYGDEGYVSNGNVEIISELHPGRAGAKARVKDDTLETCALADERIDQERRPMPSRKQKWPGGTRDLANEALEDNVFCNEYDAVASPFAEHLQRPIEQAPDWVSDDGDQYPRVGLKTQYMAKNSSWSKGVLQQTASVDEVGRKVGPTAWRGLDGNLRVMTAMNNHAAQTLPVGKTREGSKGGRVPTTLRPHDVHLAIDADVAQLMVRPKRFPTPTKAERPKKTTASKAQEKGLLSRSVNFLTQQMGGKTADEQAPQNLPRSTRAKMPQEDISKRARDAVVDQQILRGVMDLVIDIDKDTYAKLDKLDRDALEAWHNNYEQLCKQRGESRDPYQQKVDLERIVKLYQAYGTSDSAVVSQADRPYQLTVKNRKQAQATQLQQLAAVAQNRNAEAGDAASYQRLASHRSHVSPDAPQRSRRAERDGARVSDPVQEQNMMADGASPSGVDEGHGSDGEVPGSERGFGGQYKPQTLELQVTRNVQQDDDQAVHNDERVKSMPRSSEAKNLNAQTNQAPRDEAQPTAQEVAQINGRPDQHPSDQYLKPDRHVSMALKADEVSNRVAPSISTQAQTKASVAKSSMLKGSQGRSQGMQFVHDDGSLKNHVDLSSVRDQPQGEPIEVIEEESAQP